MHSFPTEPSPEECQPWVLSRSARRNWNGLGPRRACLGGEGRQAVTSVCRCLLSTYSVPWSADVSKQGLLTGLGISAGARSWPLQPHPQTSVPTAQVEGLCSLTPCPWRTYTAGVEGQMTGSYCLFFAA